MIRSGALFPGFLVLVLSALGCGQPPELPPDSERTKTHDTALIRQAVQQATAALNAADVEALLALHTEDAVVLKPGQSAEVGPAAMRASLEDLVRRLQIHESRTIEEVRVTEQWAFVWGTYQVIVTPKGSGKPSSEQGTYIDILEKGPDGVWRFARSIWNRTAPP